MASYTHQEIVRFDVSMDEVLVVNKLNPANHLHRKYKSDPIWHGEITKIKYSAGIILGMGSTSVAYRYRKSISIIELFVSIISIYIGFLATNF